MTVSSASSPPCHDPLPSPEPDRAIRSRDLLLLISLLLLALLLRLYRLDAQSLWNDEGTTMQLVKADLTTIARLAANDIHPPLYYYVLRGWVSVLGTSEFAARSFSSLMGVILVALTFLLGWRLSGTRTALVAAFLSALSPFQVYYSQEARMYMMLTMLGAASMLSYARIVHVGVGPEREHRPGISWHRTAIYVLTTCAALYTHYLALSLLLIQNLLWVRVTVCRALTDKRFRMDKIAPALASWAGMQGAIGVLYAPWLILTWQQLSRWPAVSEAFGLRWFIGRAMVIFTLGATVQLDDLVTIAVIISSAFIVLGVLDTLRRQNRDGLSAHVLAGAYWVMPSLVLYVLSRQRPLWNPKFLLLGSPAFYVLVASGVSAIAVRAARAGRHGLQVATALVLLPLTVASGFSLHNLYFDSDYARDDYRGIVRYIESTAGVDDAILIDAPTQIETVAYYYQGNLPMYPLPRRRPPLRDETESELSRIAGKHNRIYCIFWATDESDPDRIVEDWLDKHTFKAIDRWYGNVRLAVYAVPQEPPTEIVTPLDAMLGDSIQLVGYTLASPQVRPGDILQLTLFWKTLQPIPSRYKVFVHVLDEDDHILAQRDAEPGGGAKLTTTWVPGEVVPDNYGVLIPFDTAPGDYALEVGMYSLHDASRLPIIVGDALVGDRLLLEPVRVR